MGVVVAAHHLALDMRVAIKLMRPELRVRHDLVRRFLREARAAARLRSRHGTRVFDVGTLEDDAPYIVMEYLDGTDLATWLGQHSPVPVALAAAIVSQASDAIAEAHAAGIVHRDLKPANLFLTRDRDGQSLIKVLDLGICKLVGRPDAATDIVRDTSAATTLGTPAYMAPEQLGSTPRADARSDIWSLGVILYELVTGRVPFHGHTLAELRARIAGDPCPRVARADVPSEFEAIIARCLTKDPRARFQRAVELAGALARFVPAPSTALSSQRTKRMTKPALSGVTIAALVVSATAWLALSSDEATAPAASPGVPHPGLAAKPDAAQEPGRADPSGVASHVGLAARPQGALESRDAVQRRVTPAPGRTASSNVTSDVGLAARPAIPPGPRLAVQGEVASRLGLAAQPEVVSGPGLAARGEVGSHERRAEPSNVASHVGLADRSRVDSHAGLPTQAAVTPAPELAAQRRATSRAAFSRGSEAAPASRLTSAPPQSGRVQPSPPPNEASQQEPPPKRSAEPTAPAIDARAPTAAASDPLATPY